MLRELEKDATQSSPSKSNNLSEDVDMRVYREPHVENYKQRYKKQGLEYVKRRPAHLHENPVSPKIERQHREVIFDALICCCREPEGGDDLVVCNSDACMIGVFHARCVGLQDLAEDGSSVLCPYCNKNQTWDDHNFVATLIDDTGNLNEEDAASLSSPNSTSTESVSIELTQDQEVENCEQSLTRQLGVDECFCSGTGFVGINCRRPGRNASLQVDGANTGVMLPTCLAPILVQNLDGQAKRKSHLEIQIPLPEDSSLIAFSDLAPFIQISDDSYFNPGMTIYEAQAFQKWKSQCPESRLLTSLCPDEQQDGEVSVVDSGTAENSNISGAGIEARRASASPMALTAMLSAVSFQVWG
jgi:hypothetical protein